jgi:hypothetical protein
MSPLAYAGAQATSTMYDDGVSNNPACIHVDKLDAHADDKARNGTADNIRRNILRSKHVGRNADTPGEHDGGKVHNSMHSLVELGWSPPPSHSTVLRLLMVSLTRRRQR